MKEAYELKEKEIEHLEGILGQFWKPISTKKKYKENLKLESLKI